MKLERSNILICCFLACLLAGAPGHARAADMAQKVPVTVKADNLDYDRANDIYTAVGNVRIDQLDMHMQADKIVLDNRTGRAVAEGRVFFKEKGDVIRADKLEVNINSGFALIDKGDLFLSKDNFHLKGEKIERKSEAEYHIENGTFTTCDEGAWYLKADQIDVNMDRYATANGVSFNMSGLPVFYTPYLLFPVRRQSGLLMPEPGYSSSEGLLLKNTVFWAISDYKDMTFTSDYRARHGHGTGIEYRYANSRDSTGRLFANYFDTFNSTDTRWEFAFRHEEEIASDLSMRADINLVSDELYYRDIEKKLELRSRPYLDSNAFYVERWDTAALSLLGQYSIDLTQQNLKTVQKLPELKYTILQEKIAGPLYLLLNGSAVNFSVAEGAGVRRVDLGPQLTAAFSDNGIGFTPRAGVRTTYYDRGASSVEPVSRTYSFAGADLNARFSRVFGKDEDQGFGRIRHSIEPTLSYSYIPQVKQTGVTLFDAVDTVSAQNQVTLSVINRLTAHYKDAGGFKTFDMMVFRLSRSYDEAKNAGVTAHQNPDISGELYVKTPKLLSLSASANYNTYTHGLSSLLGTVVTTEPVQFDMTHQYLRFSPTNPRTEFLIGGTGFKIDKWNLSAHFWRDLENHRTTQEEYRAHYASQCWGLALSYITKPGETQYLVMLELKGLGAVRLQ